jgi:hypothetical protein
VIDERPAIHTCPTELERSDGFLDLAALAGAGLAVWWLALKGIPITFIAPFTLPFALWVLTGEAASDVPFLGAVAAALRSKLGLRRAHEWLFAWTHYWKLAVYPVWRSNCVAFSQSTQLRITLYRRQLSAATRWSRLRAYSWASATRDNMSVKLKRST